MCPSPTDWITSVTTIVLACITGYYAIITHKIMAFQKKSLELEKRPFIVSETLLYKIIIEKPDDIIAGLQIGVRLKNVSKVLINYNVTKIVGSIQNLSIHQPNFINKGGYLYPGQSTDYYYDTFKNIEINKPFIEGKFEYEIEYYSEKDKKYKTIREFQTTLFPAAKHFEWKTIKEEEQ